MQTISLLGGIKSLKCCWDTLCKLGPKIGDYPEVTKSYLIVKEEFRQLSSTMKTTSTVRIQLGAAISKTSFKEEYLVDKVKVII